MDKKNQFFFQKRKKSDPAIFETIRTACEGMEYISETDAPIVAFSAGETQAVTPENILRHAGLDSNAPVGEVAFDEFFLRLTAMKDWFGEREKTRAKRFLELKKLLEENLCDLKVYRFGKIQVDICVVGIAAGHILGFRTKAVET